MTPTQQTFAGEARVDSTAKPRMASCISTRSSRTGLSMGLQSTFFGVPQTFCPRCNAFHSTYAVGAITFADCYSGVPHVVTWKPWGAR